MRFLHACLALRMRPISTRLAIWYALAATATLVSLFATGYFLLERHVVNGLDMLNVTEFGEIKAHLVHGYDPGDPAFLERRLRRPTNRTSRLFYIHVHDEDTGFSFLSTNLNGSVIDVPPGRKTFDVAMPGIGRLRVGTFQVEPYTVTIGTPDHDLDNMLEGYAEIALILLGCMLVMSLGVGFGLSHLALRPVRVISETANRIGSDNLSERIKVGKVRDEISDLSLMLNAMFDRLEASFKQIREFSAEASHELKTPLSLVRLHTEKMLLSGGLSAAQEESVQLQLEELARLDQLIEEMLFLSRAQAHAITLVLTQENPARFLQSFAQDAHVLAEHRQCRFAHTHDGEGRVAFDQKRVRQVLLNLLSNALRVTPAGGCVTLRSLLENGLWRITFEDEGPGVPAEHMERIFERFVRLSAPDAGDNGSGLGLAICRSIVSLHRGRIFGTPSPHATGLQVVIEIPVPPSLHFAMVQ